jgi:hypothetical protein
MDDKWERSVCSLIDVLSRLLPEGLDEDHEGRESGLIQPSIRHTMDNMILMKGKVIPMLN